MSTHPPNITGAVAVAAPAATASPHDERRNFVLGVANGGTYQAGESFVDSSTVIPVLLSGLTTSHALIGLASALGDLGWLLPQIFVAPWASRKPRQMPLYRHAAIVRGACLLSLAAAAWLLGGHPTALLGAFFLFYGVFSFGAGFGGVAFMEIVGRTVRAERLGSYFAQRMFWGGTLAAVAALGTRQVLRLQDAGARFLFLFGLAAVICSTAYCLFAAVREPDTPPSPTPATPMALLRQGLHWMRHESAFRRLFVARASLSVWLTASPFVTLFVANDLEGGGRAAGTLLLSRVIGFVLANLLWQRLSRTVGNRAILRAATGTACALLLAIAGIAWASPRGAGLISSRAALLALEAAAALGGAAHSGFLVGYTAVLIETAPQGQRQAFVSLMSTFVGLTMVLPVVGGVIVDAASAPFLFLVCGLAALAGVRAAWRLPARPARPVAVHAWEHGT